MRYAILTIFGLILSLIIIQPVTAYSTSCNGLNASLGYKPFANTSGGIIAPNARLSEGCYWPGGTLYTRYSQGVATVFLWNVTNLTIGYNEGSENYQQSSPCTNYLYFGTVPAGNYTLHLYAQGPYANASCSPTYVYLSSSKLGPTSTTTTIPPTIQQCNSPAQVDLGQSLSCSPFSLTVTNVVPNGVWVHVYYNGQLIPGGNYTFTAGLGPGTVSYDDANATISLSSASSTTSPEYAVITLTYLAPKTTSSSVSSSSSTTTSTMPTSTTTVQATSIPTTTIAPKPVTGLNGYYITNAQADNLFGASKFSYGITPGLSAAGINYTGLDTIYNINSGEAVFMQNNSRGIDGLEFVINTTQARAVYNFLLNYTSLNTLPKASSTTYGYGVSSGSNQGVNYTIGVTSSLGANTYIIIAWKGDKVALFSDMGIPASQSPTGLATTLNTTLLTGIVVNDLTQPPQTTSSTVNTTTIPTTTILPINQTSSNPLSNIWNSITNFLSNLFRGL